MDLEKEREILSMIESCDLITHENAEPEIDLEDAKEAVDLTIKNELFLLGETVVQTLHGPARIDTLLSPVSVLSFAPDGKMEAVEVNIFKSNYRTSIEGKVIKRHALNEEFPRHDLFLPKESVILISTDIQEIVRPWEWVCDECGKKGFFKYGSGDCNTCSTISIANFRQVAVKHLPESVARTTKTCTKEYLWHLQPVDSIKTSNAMCLDNGLLTKFLYVYVSHDLLTPGGARLVQPPVLSKEKEYTQRYENIKRELEDLQRITKKMHAFIALASLKLQTLHENLM